MALKIMTYDVLIKYKRGPDYGNMDGLSRQAWAPKLEEGAMENPVVFAPPESGLGRGDSSHSKKIEREGKRTYT